MRIPTSINVTLQAADSRSQRHAVLATRRGGLVHPNPLIFGPGPKLKHSLLVTPATVMGFHESRIGPTCFVPKVCG